jgi:GLPGLI family protein
MTKIFLILISLCCYNGFSQNFYGEIEYKEIARYSRYGVFDCVLKFTNNESIYYINPFDSNSKNSNANSVTKRVNIKSENLSKDYFFRKNNSEEIVIHDNFLDKSIFYKDSIVQTWKLINESKTIMNLKCLKAETFFRGRKYIAWYTEELPVKYGPRNFYGLPGIILELEENTGLLKILASKIATKETDDKVSLFPVDDKSKNYISRSEYRNLKKEIRDEKSKLIESKLPKGQTLNWDCDDCIIELEIE